MTVGNAGAGQGGDGPGHPRPVSKEQAAADGQAGACLRSWTLDCRPCDAWRLIACWLSGGDMERHSGVHCLETSLGSPRVCMQELEHQLEVAKSLADAAKREASRALQVRVVACEPGFARNVSLRAEVVRPPRIGGVYPGLSSNLLLRSAGGGGGGEGKDRHRHRLGPQG